MVRSGQRQDIRDMRNYKTVEAERHHIASFGVGDDEPLASKSSLYESHVFGETKIGAD